MPKSKSAVLLTAALTALAACATPDPNIEGNPLRQEIGGVAYSAAYVLAVYVDYSQIPDRPDLLISPDSYDGVLVTRDDGRPPSEADRQAASDLAIRYCARGDMFPQYTDGWIPPVETGWYFGACRPIEDPANVASPGDPLPVADTVDELTMVELAPGTYPREDAFGAAQPDLVVSGGTYPVRRLAQDQVQVPAGTAPGAFETLPVLRVGGTEDKMTAVLAALAFCGRPVPGAAELYLWGDENVSRADDTAEWRFEGLC